MYVETSAIVAILLSEKEGHDLLAKIGKAGRPTTSIISKIEAALSIGREIKDYKLAGDMVTEFLDKAGITVLGVSSDIYDEVIETYSRYGKGTGHPARLNFGDCFSYAFAMRLGGVALFKGEDFSRTDLTSV